MSLFIGVMTGFRSNLVANLNPTGISIADAAILIPFALRLDFKTSETPPGNDAELILPEPPIRTSKSSLRVSSLLLFPLE